MKKTVLLLAFLICLIGSQGFAKGAFEKKPQKPDENIATKDDLKKMNDELIKINTDIKEIKNKQITGSTVTPPGGNMTNQVITERILVTPKIIQYLLEKNINTEGLKFFPSNKFSLEIYDQKESDEIKIDNNMIILNSPNTVNEPSKRIEISKDSEGILSPSTEPDKSGKLQISFQEQGKKINLIFRKNTQQNCYELFEANDVFKNYKIIFSEHILLYVSGQDNRKVQAVPADLANGNEQPYQKIPAGLQNDNSPYSGSIISSSKVNGTSKLTKEGIKEYIRTKNPGWEWIYVGNAIIEDYFKIAREEGVNADIAIAQMLHTTDNFKKRDRVEKTCNYGGLSNTGDFKGDFKGSSTNGIRAHIQHLKGYMKEYPTRAPFVDPRFQFAYERGYKEITFEQVCKNWSADPGYGQKIENILRDLYRISGAL